MKVLVIVENSPKQGFLVSLETDALRNDVKDLITKNKREKAMVTALSKGRVERCIPDKDLSDVDADLRLTKNGAYWDLL